MRSRAKLIAAVASIGAVLWATSDASAGADGLTLVRDGEPVAVVVVDPEAPDDALTSERGAAGVLVRWIERISDAQLAIVHTAPETGPAIFVGRAAIGAGLDLGQIDSPSDEGLRIERRGEQLLIAGQSDRATTRAVTRFLEELGCRFLIDHEIGKIHPRQATITVGELSITEKPGFELRRTGGSGWRGDTLWKIWNGQGGLELELGHVWHRYVAPELFEEHPEYFAKRDGERRRGRWFCTSNPELRRVFAEGVIREIDSGNTHPSISPAAGRGYCECADCRAQDAPERVETTSGTVSVSTRYVDFFAEIAERVAEVHPDSRVSFYAYHDYTLPPRPGSRVPSNVIIWQTPHRYCWLHGYLNGHCPSRRGQREALDEWAPVARTFGYHAHNYNYGDLIIPFARLGTWAMQIPDLHRRGMIGLSFDTVPNWGIYGPHIYLSLRLAYDPGADADAIMDDYFRKLLGPDAGPLVQRYWQRIDRAYAASEGHNTMFYSMHHVFTPELLSELRAEL